MGLPRHASEFWAERTADYDAYIRRVVPRYDEALDALLAYAPPFATCLELGCGTGNLSLRLAQARPAASFTFVDGSSEMIAATRARLQAAVPGAADRAVFRVARFEDLTPGDGYDLVVSSLALHHVPDIAGLYPVLAAAVAPGGTFLMYDGIRGETDAIHARHLARWHAFWLQPGNLDAAEIADVVMHVGEHDTYHPLRDHVRWLARCGLQRTDCVWRDGLFAIVSATRP